MNTNNVELYSHGKTTLRELVIYASMFSLILPLITLAGFEMPFSYLFAIPLTVYALIVFKKDMLRIRILVILGVLSVLIVFGIFLTTAVSTYSKLGTLMIPTDSAQYIIRFMVLLSLIVIAMLGIIKIDRFILVFSIVLLLAMLIGVLQWVPWPGREFFIRLYPFRDGSLQLSQLERPLHRLRMHGFAQHATATGGLAVFSIAYSYACLRYYKKHRALFSIIILLSLVNILASQARIGLLALVGTVFLFYIIEMLVTKKYKKASLIFFGGLAFVMLVIFLLYLSGNSFINMMVYRWSDLIATRGGPRANTQPQYFFSLMRPIDYVLGLSKPIVNMSEISYGIEIEPLNILVTYGSIGFLLQYGLVFVIAYYLITEITRIKQDSGVLALSIAAFVGLLSYLIFSLAFFFYREIRIGLFPWILIGVAIGFIEYRKRQLILKCNRKKEE